VSPRDPVRIRPTLDAIETVWKKNPDMRLGQLIVNLGRARGLTDPWPIEDADLVATADRIAAEGWKLIEVEPGTQSVNGRPGGSCNTWTVNCEHSREPS
jgi:hypothetical protein